MFRFAVLAIVISLLSGVFSYTLQDQKIATQRSNVTGSRQNKMKGPSNHFPIMEPHGKLVEHFLGVKGPEDCGTDCVNFPTKNLTDVGELDQVLLYIRKHNQHVVPIDEYLVYVKDGDDMWKFTARKTNDDLSSEWLTVDVTSAIELLLLTPTISISVHCLVEGNELTYLIDDRHMLILGVRFNQPVETSSQGMNKRTKRSSSPCGLIQTMNLVMKGVSDSIIAPDTVRLTYCSGTCNKYDSNHVNTARYANASQACCISTSYADLTILYYDDNGNPRQGILRNFLVTGCQCHL